MMGTSTNYAYNHCGPIPTNYPRCVDTIHTDKIACIVKPIFNLRVENIFTINLAHVRYMNMCFIHDLNPTIKISDVLTDACRMINKVISLLYYHVIYIYIFYFILRILMAQFSQSGMPKVDLKHYFVHLLKDFHHITVNNDWHYNTFSTW